MRKEAEELRDKMDVKDIETLLEDYSKEGMNVAKILELKYILKVGWLSAFFLQTCQSFVRNCFGNLPPYYPVFALIHLYRLTKLKCMHLSGIKFAILVDQKD